MNVHNKCLILLLSISFIAAGCATSTKGKIARNAFIAGSIGAAYGNSREDYKTTHSVLYGSMSAIVAALASLYYYDPDAEIAELRKQNTELAKSLNSFSENSNQQRGKKTYSGPAINNYQSIPEKYRSKITPGEWSLMEIDEVEQVDENKLVRKTELLEIKPPQINQN